jgi:hypothetical protein
MHTHTRRAWLLALAAAPALHGQTDPSAWLDQLGFDPQKLLGAPVDPAEVRRQSVLRLTRLFDGFLQKPADYPKRVLEECDGFPEGRVYSFILPALGYANLGFSGQLPRDAAVNRMRWMIDLSLPVIADFVQAPERDLLRLKTYARHGTFLSTLNLALATHERLGGGNRYQRLHDHLSGLLLQAVTAAKGGPIDSYPTYTWYFDTLMALLSLRLWEEARGRTGADAMLDAHLAWRRENATDKATGLPRAFRNSPPRGCDVSMQVCLLAQMRPEEAKALYGRFVAAHWKELPMLAGFTEWPRGTPAPAGGDIDSGPVVFEIGATASGVGLGAAIAMGDAARRDRLLTQLETAQPLLRAVVAGQIRDPGLDWLRGLKLDERYLTRFLYGDAVLFYAMTWTRLPPAAPAR